MHSHDDQDAFARAIQASFGEHIDDVVWAFRTLRAADQAAGINQPPVDLPTLTAAQVASRQFHGYDRPRPGQGDEE